MEIQKKKDFIIRVLYFAIILGIVIFLCRQGILPLMPFVVAFLVALLVKPAVRFCTEKLHIQKNIAGAVLVIIFYALIGLLLTFLGIKLFTTVKNFVMQIPTYYSTTIEPLIVSMFDTLEAFSQKLDPSAAITYDAIVPQVTSAIEGSLSALSVKVLNFATSTAISIPGFLLNTLIAIIATVFIAIDWNLLKDFLLRQFSDQNKSLLHNIRIHLGKTLGCYMRSYALILLITFAELSIGLLIIGRPNPFGLAAGIAVFDILPVVGSGTVLIPWAIISVISGDYLLALGLGILYVVMVIVRNIIEPKIVGQRVGLHPIVTLLAMVVGTYVFGPIGLLGLPIALALVASLNEQGVIHLYNRSAKPDACDPASSDAEASEKPSPDQPQPDQPSPDQSQPDTDEIPTFGKDEIDIDPEDD